MNASSLSLAKPGHSGTPVAVKSKYQVALSLVRDSKSPRQF